MRREEVAGVEAKGVLLVLKRFVLTLAVAIVALFGMGGLAYADTGATPGYNYFGTVFQQVGYVLGALGTLHLF